MPRLSNLLFIGAVGLACGAAASAQDHPAQAPVPPPPGINDPGVRPAVSGSAPAPGGLRGLPDMPALGGTGANRNALGQPPPTMDIREVGGDKVEEYRINGRIYMIHVIPKHGVPQTYMANPQGELMRQVGQPPVKPVFYTIYKWGGPKKKDNGADNGK